MEKTGVPVTTMEPEDSTPLFPEEFLLDVCFLQLLQKGSNLNWVWDCIREGFLQFCLCLNYLLFAVSVLELGPLH